MIPPMGSSKQYLLAKVLCEMFGKRSWDGLADDLAMLKVMVRECQGYDINEATEEDYFIMAAKIIDELQIEDS